MASISLITAIPGIFRCSARLRSPMWIKACIALLFLFFSFLAQAQPETLPERPSYFLSVHAGGAFGKKGQGSSLASALIQGVRYKWIALGAGVGYDAYSEWRAIPFFASVSMD